MLFDLWICCVRFDTFWGFYLCLGVCVGFGYRLDVDAFGLVFVCRPLVGCLLMTGLRRCLGCIWVVLWELVCFEYFTWYFGYVLAIW